MKRKIETRCPILEIEFFLERKFFHLRGSYSIDNTKLWPRIKFDG